MSAVDAFLLAFLINVAWQASLIVAMGGCGLWLLQRATPHTKHLIADPFMSTPSGALPFASAIMTIAIEGTRLAIFQTRTISNGRTEQVRIEGRTDRTPFQVRMPGGQLVRTHAHWRGDRLIAAGVFAGSGQVEHDEAFVRDGKLVVLSRSSTRQNDERTLELVFRGANVK